MKIANEFIRQENQIAKQIKTEQENQKTVVTNNNNNLNEKTEQNNKNKQTLESNSVSESNKNIKKSSEIEKSNNSTSNIITTNTINSNNNNHVNHQHQHQHHNHHVNCRRKINRNPKAFYQQMKKNNKTQSLKAMRNKTKTTPQSQLQSLQQQQTQSEIITDINEVAVPSPFVYTKNSLEDDQLYTKVLFKAKSVEHNFLVDFNNRPVEIFEKDSIPDQKYDLFFFLNFLNVEDKFYF